jgi:hypothetical protein
MPRTRQELERIERNICAPCAQMSGKSRGPLYSLPYDGLLLIGVMMMEATKGLARSRSA